MVIRSSVKKKRNKRLKIGLALGSGAARGLAHIGILKVLHQNNIYPDYIAGSSMGAVIGAFYVAGYSPDEIEEIAKTTNWQDIVDFTVPKAGLIKGDLMEKKLRRMMHRKKFKDLSLPFSVVAYNIKKHEKAILSEGDVAKAVKASISIPGIFTPTRIGHDHFIDGGVIDPTPYDVVKKMGADIIIAVDLYVKLKTTEGPIVKETSFFDDLKQKFIVTELLNIKNYLIPTRWPNFIRHILIKIFEMILYPARILKIMAGRELPTITKVMYETMDVLTNNLAAERINHADIDFKITPEFNKDDWLNFQAVDYLVKVGEEAMSKHIGKLKKKLRRC